MLVTLTIVLLTTLTSCTSSQDEKEELIRPKNAELIFSEVVNVYVQKTINPNNIHLITIRNSLKHLPQSIKDILVENKYEIYLVSDISDVSKNGNTKSNGKHDIENRLIMVEFTTIDPSKTLLHEVGHAFDWGNSYEKMRYSTNSDFKNAMSEEVKDLFNQNVFTGDSEEYLSHVSDNQDEYFAECFALYFSNEIYKEKLSVFAPKTYVFINNLF